MDQNKTNYSPAHILAREHLFTVICLYTVFYIFWFRHLEQTVSGDYLIMHTKVDEWIPFLPVFIVPYLLWFLYIFAALVYFSRADKDEAADLCLFLALGMTSSLLICTLFPNGTDLRITANPANGFFEHLVWMIQGSAGRKKRHALIRPSAKKAENKLTKNRIPRGIRFFL